MIQVEFGYKGKSASKFYELGKSIKDCNLGDMKPTRAIIYGEDMSIGIEKLDKWIATIGKALSKDGYLEDTAKVGKTTKKEVKNEPTGKSTEDKESL